MKGVYPFIPGSFSLLKETTLVRVLLLATASSSYNEPSALWANGLLLLPGEDELPPDIARKHFEPPLRAWVAPRSGMTGSNTTEKKESPVLLLGAGPVTPSGNSEDSRNRDSAGNPSEGQGGTIS